jgi:uncharacterized membrane protein
MQMRTYRLIVIGSILSSCLVGLHLPALHDMTEHGATPRWEVVIATIVLVIGTLAGTWRLLRLPPVGDHVRD